MNVLELVRLTVGYRTRRSRKVVLAGLDTSLEKDRLVGLVGPNGTGKFILPHAVSRLQPPLAGSVRLLGWDPGRIRRDEMAQQAAVVLIDRVDLGRLTAADVVVLGEHLHTGWFGWPGASDREAVTTALRAVEVGELAKRMLRELSDGRRQWVMITRAIAQALRLLLFSEPTVFLDLPGRTRVFELLQDLAHNRELVAVVCTHDVEVATRHVDRLWMVGPKSGIRVGAPHELVHDGTLGVAFGGDAGFNSDSYTFVSHRSQPDRGGHQGST